MVIGQALLGRRDRLTRQRERINLCCNAAKAAEVRHGEGQACDGLDFGPAFYGCRSFPTGAGFCLAEVFAGDALGRARAHLGRSLHALRLEGLIANSEGRKGRQEWRRWTGTISIAARKRRSSGRAL